MYDVSDGSPSTPWRELLIAPVIVGALGYFVDIYDLVLFSIVRVASLKELGVPEDLLFATGVRLINAQMLGMLFGGIVWGILGDKRGRVSVLFGSILLYSSANLLNAFVTSVDAYAVLRFLAGLGLAGELGAAITLVSEVLPQRSRGYGTMLVAAIGITGALLAATIGENFSWRIAYGMGGVLGLLLLVLRVKTRESGMFESARGSDSVTRGDFFMLFRSRERFTKYLSCIAIGVPVWFAIGVVITFSPEIARALGVEGAVTGGRAIFFSYAGLSLGDLAAGYLSQRLRSRRRAVFAFLGLSTAVTASLYFIFGVTTDLFYFFSFCLGLSAGYWALFVTVAAEQFGTNLRATVAITVPNFVRGSVVPLTLFFRYLIPNIGTVPAVLATGAAGLAVAWIGAFRLEESFHKDLNHFEETRPA